MQHKLVWATLFGLFLTLLSGVIVTSKQDYGVFHSGYSALDSHQTVYWRGLPISYLKDESTWFYSTELNKDWWDESQTFEPVIFAFDWALISFVLALAFGGWRDLTRYFSSAEGMRAMSKVCFLLGIGGLLLSFAIGNTIIISGVLWCIFWLAESMWFEYDANVQEVST